MSPASVNYHRITDDTLQRQTALALIQDELRPPTEIAQNKSKTALKLQ